VAAVIAATGHSKAVLVSAGPCTVTMLWLLLCNAVQQAGCVAVVPRIHCLACLCCGCRSD
jgi:hypothetical protein